MKTENQRSLKTENLKTMKTSSMRFMKVMYSISLILTILALSSCNNNKGEKNEKKVVKVEAPALDIHSAVLLGDLKAIEQHIEAGTDLNVGDPTVGSTPLMIAAVFNRIEIASALIMGGTDLNQTNNDGATALHSAAFLCRTEIVEMLIENGADKSIVNNFGLTAAQSVAGPFESIKFVYDQFSKDLGPLGLKLDYEQLEETRPVIAEMLK